LPVTAYGKIIKRGRTIKVLGITCGRKNGNSELLMKQAFKAIEEKCGAETAFIRLQDAYRIIPG
jgi:multimeric flavodoxin WrbA